MRSGLSLHIPGIKELSPCNLRLHQGGNSSKPPSPMSNDLKQHHRAGTNSSPYNRITSKTSIKKCSIPSFLTASQVNCNSIIGKSTHSDLATDSSSIHYLKPKQKMRNPDEFFKLVFKGPAQEEVLLKVGKFELNRWDLQSLQPNSETSRNAIDACLRCIMHKNKKVFKSSESHDRVMIVNTQLAQIIFTEDSKKKLSFDKNPLKYEFVAFPVFIEYWTLVLLDNRMKKISIYNAEEGIAFEIFECIKRFIKKMLKAYEGKKIDESAWRDITLECLQVDGIKNVDSAVFMIRCAYKVAVNKKALVSAEVLNEYRYVLLVMLYKHGVLM